MSTVILQGPNFLPFDIETVANAAAKAYYASKTYEAPSNYKDQEKIDKYILEKRFEDEKKAALSWWTGKVVCIHVRSVFKKIGKSFVGENEAALLNAFFTWVAAEGHFILIGKSSKYFDKPFILGRCIALDIGIPQFLRPYRPLEDIDEVFGLGARADQAGKLSDYAAGMGIKGKSGNGQDVQHWYNVATTGKDPDGFKKIASYCEDDVMIVDEFLRRWNKTWTPTGAVTDNIAPMPIPFGGTEVHEPSSGVLSAEPAKPAKKTKAPKAAVASEPEPTAPAPVMPTPSPMNEMEFE